VRKCPYCDFNSHALSGDIPEAAYLAALLEDLAEDLGGVQGRPIETIFIGGGTPSLMSADFYERLFGGLRAHLTIADTAEITLEANPGTLEQGRFEGFRGAGINRLSIGVQSFNSRHLETLGRIHDATAAERAIEAALTAGFENFNVDLMHGLPDQSVDEALDDLDRAMAWGPSHLSWYQLTLEPNTEFFSHPPRLPDDDKLWDIYSAGTQLLHRHGYTDYEVSAWSQPGKASRHNLNYWQFGDYLALGAGAHGKITWFPESGHDGPHHADIHRYWKTRQPGAYLNRLGSRTAGKQMIEPDELALEFMMNALRLSAGVEEDLFPVRTGLPVSQMAEILADLRKRKLLELHRLQATALGRRYLNTVLERFL
jgi:oxygen-independent coproporphyrinogen-3 oxidase